MKKHSICAALLLLTSCGLLADLRFPVNQDIQKFKISGRQNKTSQSFLFTRPVYWNIEAREFMAHEFFADKNCNGSAFQVVGFYQNARPSEKIGKYFAINDKNLLTVKGDDVDPINRDVRAEWVGLDADFNGCLQLTPQQTQWAVYFQFHQDLKRFVDIWMLSDLYLSLRVPVQNVKNNINFEQFISVPSQRPGPIDLKQAFNRCELKFAKIPTESDSITSVPELIFQLGAYFTREDGFEIGAYNVLHIPTAQKAEPEFLFDPFLGQNRHWGLGGGANFQLPINCSTDIRVFAFYADLEYLYLFRADQIRTIDIKNKPWSRYLLLNAKNGQRNIPAANVLTREVRTEPFSYFNGSGGFRFYNDTFVFEFGYGLWAHGDENLRLKEPFKPEFGIAGEPDPNQPPLIVDCVPVGPTASKSTISCQAPNDVNEQGELVFVPIKFTELNFFSGAARSALAHRAHVAVGFKADGPCFGFFAGIGFYGQFPNTNTAFSAWGLWAKFGGTF